jgi:hypothetical protein
MKDKIIEVLKRSSYPMRARYIARQLGVDRTTINRILYSNLNNPFIKNDNFEWGLNNKVMTLASETNWNMKRLLDIWLSLIDYILEIYNKEPQYFDFEDFNYSFKDKSMQIIAEIEVYIMRLLLNIKYSYDSDSIEDEDILELLNQLGPSLKLEYRNSTYTFGLLKSDLIVRDMFILKFLLSIIRFDDANETRKIYILLNMIQSIAFNWSSANESNASGSFDYFDLIEDLKEYVSEVYDYTAGSKNSFDKCVVCDNWVYDEIQISESGNYYCFDCRYSGIISFLEFENGDFIEKEENDVVEINETESGKDEITEDCSTCQFKKNGYCKKTHINIVCEKYVYKP